MEVLVEEDQELNGKEVQTGHTKEYMKIALEINENLKNSIVKVQIGKDSQIIPWKYYLSGRLHPELQGRFQAYHLPIYTNKLKWESLRTS